jgi:hypothetical protein
MSTMPTILAGVMGLLEIGGNDPISMVPYNFTCSIPDFKGATRFRRGFGSSSGHAEARSTS